MIESYRKLPQALFIQEHLEGDVRDFFGIACSHRLRLPVYGRKEDITKPGFLVNRVPGLPQNDVIPLVASLWFSHHIRPE